MVCLLIIYNPLEPLTPHSFTAVYSAQAKAVLTLQKMSASSKNIFVPKITLLKRSGFVDTVTAKHHNFDLQIIVTSF